MKGRLLIPNEWYYLSKPDLLTSSKCKKYILQVIVSLKSEAKSKPRDTEIIRLAS